MQSGSYLQKKRRGVLRKQALYFAAASVAVTVLMAGGAARLSQREVSVVRVFDALALSGVEGRISLTARIPSDSRRSEEELVQRFARRIGLSLPEAPRRVSYQGRDELIYERTAAGAFSSVRLVRLLAEREDYLCVEITLFGASPEALTELRGQMEKAAEKADLTEITVNYSLTGSCAGELPLAEKDRLADTVMQRLGAQVAYENRQNDNYMVYGYTTAEAGYLTVGGRRVNVQVSISYEEETDCTQILLASPVDF